MNGRIELEPDLENCIHTVAKREYDRISAILLNTGSIEKGLQQRLEILRLFLESADFPKLRADYEKHLQAGKRVRFVICLHEHQLDWCIDVL